MPLTIKEETFTKAWLSLLDNLVHRGEERSPRGLPTREFLAASFHVTKARNNLLDHPARNLNFKFAVAEWLWIMSGSESVEEIAKYNSRLREFSDDGVTLKGAYGPRLVAQQNWVLDKLSQSDTRQAVMTIWVPSPPPSKDIPCTVSFQFVRRDNTLNLIASMRSSDAWLGLPYDFFTFSQILNCYAGQLGCDVGWLQFFLGSSHIYDNDLAGVKACIDTPLAGRTIVSPVAPGLPPAWLLNRLINDQGPLTDGYAPWSTYQRVLASTRNEAYDILSETFA